MNKTVKFVSGNEYCLRELFGNNTKIVIPDLQRDYCWGDNAYTDADDRKPHELVTAFLKNIVEMLNEDRSKCATLGLIYAYEQPQNHIQICDGQQRLTTIFLLLGYINMRTSGKFKDYIISTQEREDDYEPHLLYAIRESTLYFLSDLARMTFIDGDTTIKDIRTSEWYFNEYDQDASIQSMIAALTTIDKYFATRDLDMESLGNFVLDKLRVLYYDMENRSRGEETYVVINTTGEPLSATENIKPILLGNTRLTAEESKKYSEQWEAREDWFWQNRGDDKTSDAGMLVFFTWYWQIGLIQESSWTGEKRQTLNIRDLFLSAPKKMTENTKEVKLSMKNYEKFRSLENLDKYFQALCTLTEAIRCNAETRHILASIKSKEAPEFNTIPGVWRWLRTADLDIVLPLIAFIAENGATSMLPTLARRLRRNNYDAAWGKDGNELTRRGKNYMDWRYIIQMINQTTNENLLNADIRAMNISKIPQIEIPVWYDENEKQETWLEKQHLDVKKMEANEFLMGDLTPLWTDTDRDMAGIEKIQKRWNILNKISNALNPEEASSDIEFSNWFRLYRLVNSLVTIQHISYCAWTFEGCYYSSKPDSPLWIENEAIKRLMNSANAVEFMKKCIRGKVKPFIRQPSDYRELLISWMTIKTILADKGHYLLNYWNDRAISVYLDLASNYIYSTDVFHWGNVLCGYSWRNGTYPASNEQNWNRPENLDSPITHIGFIADYDNRNKNSIDWNAVTKGDEETNNIIDCFIEGECL